MKRALFLLFVCLMCFCAVGTTPAKAAFSESDLEGTWDYIYYFAGFAERLLAVTTFDVNGSITSGTLSTEGETILLGSATFTDQQAGTLSGSITSSAAITSNLTGTMNAAKDKISGSWSNSVGDWGTFYTVKRPTAGSTTFSISDFQGKWSITYYHVGDNTPYSGHVTYDASGIQTSGAFTTAGITLDSGGATFADFDAGSVYCSALYDDAGNAVVTEMGGTMNPAKDTITGSWGDWLGNSGTVTLEKPAPVVPAAPDGGGGGGCFIGTIANSLGL